MIRRQSYGDWSSESLQEYFTNKETSSIYSETFNTKETLQCIALSLEKISIVLDNLFSRD